MSGLGLSVPEEAVYRDFLRNLDTSDDEIHTLLGLDRHEVGASVRPAVCAESAEPHRTGPARLRGPGDSRRRLALAVETVLTPALGGTGESPEMLLRLETAEGAEGLAVHSAAAGAYGEGESALSQDLLARFVDGAASPRTVTARGRVAGGTTPKPSERLALLRKWTGG
ncbi:hypothetical protein ACF08N_20030 [Streptomyces sp. NPDC015127]|uniref:hypothetical protein n=1 Tax=Streptomyces sp. NPDC015127 TaxID=3364939 RepID=UPI0036F64625